MVKAQKANLRDRPSRSGSVVGIVNKGDLLALVEATPIGPWYRIRDSKSDSLGWVHGDTIALLHTGEAAAASRDSAQRPRRTSPPAAGRSYINVDGVRVPSPVFSETKPAGATARCRDGSYSFSHIDAARVRITVELQSGIRLRRISWANNWRIAMIEIANDLTIVKVTESFWCLQPASFAALRSNNKLFAKPSFPVRCHQSNFEIVFLLGSDLGSRKLRIS